MLSGNFPIMCLTAYVGTYTVRYHDNTSEFI